MPKIIVEESIVSALTQYDRAALFDILLHRCSDAPLLQDSAYRDTGIDASERLYAMTQWRLMEPVEYGAADPAYFLTMRGVSVVRRLYGELLMRDYWQGENRVERFTAGKLHIRTKNINHQMHLNRFAHRLLRLPCMAHTRYYDGKLMPPASNFMMPDGMIESDGGYLFLETDMNTEGRKGLARKWESYRSFLRDPGVFYREKPITMLFILENITYPDTRRCHITEQILTYLGDHIGVNIEIYIGTPDALYSVWEEKGRHIENGVFRVLWERHGFSLSARERSDRVTGRLWSTRYRRAGAQDWIVVDWTDRRCSVYRVLTHFSRVKAEMRRSAGCAPPHLLVVPSEQEAYRILRCARVCQPDRVYFTTPKRLEKREFAPALFRIDALGNLYRYTDDTFCHTTYERRFGRR